MADSNPLSSGSLPPVTCLDLHCSLLQFLMSGCRLYVCSCGVCPLQCTYTQAYAIKLSIFGFPGANWASCFTLHFSGDSASHDRGQADVDTTLSTKAERALRDWIPVSSRLCAVRCQQQQTKTLIGSCSMILQTMQKNIFIVLVAPHVPEVKVMLC
ncbi:hypothetical protein D915_005038 [Fasciola hepatica]|uniref:Uncharacterized protein n=1 Tax=Fasciola hepatica TaxID=6192 RepID=A0A4E0RU10_FASHE|nr:hypothetical protein D915_005038 [Fasciola hepatica]